MSNLLVKGIEAWKMISFLGYILAIIYNTSESYFAHSFAFILRI